MSGPYERPGGHYATHRRADPHWAAQIADALGDARLVVNVGAVAEALPLRDGIADAALAVLTVHHWRDAAAGFAELRRVARRQVVVTWDPAMSGAYWLVADYVPSLAAHEAHLVTLDAVTRHLRTHDVRPLLVPADCSIRPW